ncbi:MAG: hypothetical protein MI824_04205, partial [Hyphomicrobiales bacterium]|nr:hypothetical protein [Hyphomicrobiales bacterium]
AVNAIAAETDFSRTFGSGDDTVTIYDFGTSDDGLMVMYANGTPEVFRAPTNSFSLTLGIDDPATIDGDDTVNIYSMDSGFSADVTIDGGGSPDVIREVPLISALTLAGLKTSDDDTVNIEDDLVLPGSTLNVKAENIRVRSGVVINTESDSGDAGSVIFSGTSIRMEQDSAIYAEANGTGGAAGSVTFEASDKSRRFVEVPWAFTNKTVDISLTGATIKAGDIKFEATSKDIAAASEGWGEWGGFSASSVFTDVIATLLGFFGVSVAGSIRGADATITVDSSAIVSSGAVTMEAITEASTITEAIVINTLKNSPVAKGDIQFAAAFAATLSTAKTLIQNGTSITAADDVLIAADGKVKAQATATATNNTQAGGTEFKDVDNTKKPTSVGDKMSGNTKSFALTGVGTDLTVQSKVDIDSVITSGGSVNVQAIGTNETTAKSTSTQYLGGQVGFIVAVAVDVSDIDAIVDGTIEAAGGTSFSAVDTFDAADGNAIDLNENTITFDKDHGFEHGELVNYVVGDKDENDPVSAVGGLEDGATYYVDVIDSKTIRLTKQPWVDIDNKFVDQNSTHSFQKSDAIDFTLDIVTDVDGDLKDELYVPGHDFDSGDFVAYAFNGNQAISGLAQGEVYAVEEIDGAHVALLEVTDHDLTPA